MGDRATSFGADAAAYDRARPGYPATLLDWLTAGTGEAVDAGCGTGKLGLALQERGWRVVGVEADERMAAVARAGGLTVEVARFEDWDAGGRRFDLVASAQAWHWIDPDAGARRAAEILRPGGRLAVIWNLYRHEPGVKVAMEGAYREAAPELLGSVPLGVEETGEPLAGVEATGAFEPQQRRTDVWQRRYTTAAWLEELGTHSSHSALPPDRLADLRAALAAAVPDGLTLTIVTLTITATRR